MKTKQLNNPDLYPKDEVLQEALENHSFNLFKSFRETIIGDEYELILEWKFYNDGKEWLCKVTGKKKTVLWISVHKSYFTVSFHFAERHRETVLTLAISETLKEVFSSAKPAGRLVSLIIDVRSETEIAGALTLIQLKKNLK